MPRYSSFTELEEPDTPERMSSDSSETEEIPHASTLPLPDLEALLAQQEQRSRDALGSAQAKKKEAERHIQQAAESEHQAHSFRIDYEQAESAIQELWKLVFEKNKEALERQVEMTSLNRASAKRPFASDQESHSAPERVSKRVATETLIKRELTLSLPLRGRSESAGHRGSPRTLEFIRRVKADAVVLPSRSANPRDIFAHSSEDHPLRHTGSATGLARMVRYDNPEEILIYISGQTIPKDRRNKRSGCAVISKTEQPANTPKPVAFSLEKNGLSGQTQSNTPIAAALRALVAALELKTWGSEGWKQVTIATDDKGLYAGITRHIVKWSDKGWLSETSNHQPASPALWIRALDLINEQAYHGCEVKFWLITAEQNQHTAKMARTIATSDSRSLTYTPCGDVGCTFKMALENL